jgi:hypothetical protein
LSPQCSTINTKHVYDHDMTTTIQINLTGCCIGTLTITANRYMCGLCTLKWSTSFPFQVNYMKSLRHSAYSCSYVRTAAGHCCGNEVAILLGCFAVWLGDWSPTCQESNMLGSSWTFYYWSPSDVPHWRRIETLQYCNLRSVICIHKCTVWSHKNHMKISGCSPLKTRWLTLPSQSANLKHVLELWCDCRAWGNLYRTSW